MSNKINIADIIRNFDVNTNDNLELWSTEHKDYVTVIAVTDKFIVCCYNDNIFNCNQYGEHSSSECILFPNVTNLNWEFGREILYPRFTGAVIIDGDGDPIYVGKDCYYYFNYFIEDSAEIQICRFNKLNYNNARFATKDEREEFFSQLAENNYVLQECGVPVYNKINDKNNVSINYDNPFNKTYFHKTFTDIDELVKFMNDNETDYSLVNSFTQCNEIVAIFKKIMIWN